MARKKTVLDSSLLVEGKRFWLDQNLRFSFAELIAGLGGQVQDEIDANLDYLVLDESRQMKATPCPAEKEAARVGGAITVLYADDLWPLLVPTRELALTLLRGGSASRDRWDKVRPQQYSDEQLDLSGADLRGADLTGFSLEGCRIDGILLDGATVGQAPNGIQFEEPRNVDFRTVKVDGILWVINATHCNFDGLDLAEFRAGYELRNCSFRGTRIRDGRFPGGPSCPCVECDFTEAHLERLRVRDWYAISLSAPRADFSGADLEHGHLPGANLEGANFTEAILAKVELREADLRKATLRGAKLGEADLTRTDLTGTDLRDADLRDADLTGARLDGADFTGARLRGAKLDPGASEQAVGLAEALAAVPRPGPFLKALIAAVGTASFEASFTLVSPTRGVQQVELSRETYSTGLCRTDGTGRHAHRSPSWEGALLDLAADLADAELQLHTVRVKITLADPALSPRFVQALCELFGQPVPETKAIARARKAARERAAGRRDPLIAELKKPGGVAAWNNRPALDRVTLGVLDGGDLSGASLRGIQLAGQSCVGASFASTDLREACLTRARLRKCNFQNARLNGADLSQADLCGADLTGADLIGVRVKSTRYDADTRFPVGFTPDARWKWAGSTSPPAVAVVPPAKEDLDFAAFYGKLPGVADAGRIANAVEMLRTEKFSLLAETTDEQVIGVVRSQSSEERVYACRLTSAGQYECGTQNLRPCGGLRGAVCKHLLVLILGLTKAGSLDSGTALQWLQMAEKQSPTFDKEATTATFLKYKGVVAGEIDWRPTETVPEDYYAL